MLNLLKYNEAVMKKSILKVTSLIICITTGILFTYMITHSPKESSGSNKIVTPKVLSDYQSEINNISVMNKELRDSINVLESKIVNYQSSEEVDVETIVNELYKELNKYDIISGKTDVQGPGVQITMSDSDHLLQAEDNINDYIIHNSDVLEIINELKFAGAEIIALNGYQLAWNSNIDCAGPVIYIDDFIAGTPFKIEAIGDKDTMMATLESPDSYIEFLRYRTINVSVFEKESIILKKN